MNRIYLEEQIRIEREKLNQIILDNDLDMACEEVLRQSEVVDIIITKLMNIERNAN